MSNETTPGSSEPEWNMERAKFPGKEKMIEQLRDANLYGETEIAVQMLNSFLEQIANSEKFASGVVLAWIIAKETTMAAQPSGSRKEIYINFERVVGEISPNPGFTDLVMKANADFNNWADPRRN